MKKADIEIEVKFGSKFQEKFARDSLFAALKTWKEFVVFAHQGNSVQIKINGDLIHHLDFFNWEKRVNP